MRVSAAGPWRLTCRTEARDWLRRHRVELNAMTTPQFIGWLDDKMAAFGNGKLVPPARVLTDDLSEHARGPAAPADHRADPARGRIEEKVAAALQKMDLPVPEELCTVVEAALVDQPAASWRHAIERLADQLLASQGRDRGPQEHGA